MYVDAAFAVHKDMRGHTRALITMGRGAAFSKSSKQKLNMKNLTEDELVGVNDIMMQVIWTRYFLEVKGYKINYGIIYQDNQSDINMYKNGRRLSSKWPRHISIR